MKPQDARRELSGNPRHEDPADPRDFHAWSQTQGHDPGGYSRRHGGREGPGFSDHANPPQREQGRYAPLRSLGGLDWDDAQLEPYPGGYRYEDRRAGQPEPRSFRGRGPRGYTRSDERISEDIHERLTDDPMLDAGDITVDVHEGEVTLGGQVERRWLKHHAEDLVDACSGVRGIRNELRVGASTGNDATANANRPASTDGRASPAGGAR